jgi:acyl phosphate:glycerol-3-phosphate acyltransferase
VNVAAFALLPAAYLLGTFPSAVLVARAKGVDIRAVGSGNPGASNVARTLGTRWGVAVFALDAAKGAIPAAVGLALDSRPWAYGLAAAAVIGHMAPVWNLRGGGKGVATAGGAMAVLQPIVFGVLLVSWVLVRQTTKKASVASLVVAIGLPIGSAVAGAPGWEVGAVVALAALVITRHTDNIRRLMRRTELQADTVPGGS